MAALNPILVYPASISEFTIVYYSSRDGEVTITRNDFSKNTKLNCLQYNGPSIQNIVSAVASSYPEPRLSEKQDDVEGTIYTVDFRPEQLYAYTKEGIDMYAWTIENGSRVNPSSCTTIYTKTPVLDTANGVFYDENGVEYDTWMGYDVEITNSTYFMTNTHVAEATAEKITMSASDPT